MRKDLSTVATLILATLMLQACSAMHLPKLHLPKLSIPKVHKITIQQGNVITQQMIDRLKPGMTRSQVVFVMGKPVLLNPFNQHRWDYVYTVRIPNGGSIEQKVSLYFSNERLAYFTGDLAPTSAIEKTAAAGQKPAIDIETTANANAAAAASVKTNGEVEGDADTDDLTEPGAMQPHSSQPEYRSQAALSP